MDTAKKSKNISNLTGGSIWVKIILFALPLAASSIIQQLFNSADMAIVGRFEGKEALAAVGSNASLINLLLNMFSGLCAGANIVIARCIGNGDNKRITNAVHTTVVVAIISGIFMAFVGILVAKPILKLMSTPDDVINLATIYLRIYFAGMPFIMLYNFVSAIFRSIGNSKKTLYSLTFAGIANVILNVIFVVVFKMGVAGVAVATVIANMISSLYLVYSLTKEKGALKLNLKMLKIDKGILRDIVAIGVPAGLQGMVFSISNVSIQSSVNSLGTNVVSASSASLNLEQYIFFVLNGFGQSSVTFVSQSYGAGDIKRCREIVRISLILSIAGTILMSILFLIFGKQLLSIYTTNAEIIDIAFERMKYTVTFQFTASIMNLISNAIRGMGYSLIPAIISTVGICGIRLVWIYSVFAVHHTFAVLMMVYPISQSITAAAQMIYYIIVQRKISGRMQTQIT